MYRLSNDRRVYSPPLYFPFNFPALNHTLLRLCLFLFSFLLFILFYLFIFSLNRTGTSGTSHISRFTANRVKRKSSSRNNRIA